VSRSETRETFASLAGWEKALWYGLIAASLVLFGWGIWRLIRRYRAGTSNPALERSPPRIGHTLRIVLTHAWIRRRAGTLGLAHAAVFYGFLVLFAGTVILAFQDDVARPIFGWTFWEGPFYLGYSLFLDLFGAAMVAGLILFAVARAANHPGRLDEARRDRTPPVPRPARSGDVLFLPALLFLGISGFLLEALRVAREEPSFERWAPAGWSLGKALGAMLEPETAETIHHATWWLHGVVALFFVALVPFSKGLHMLVGPANVALRDTHAGSRLVPVADGATSDQVGYGRLADISPVHLLSLDACTKCGKCTEACPATETGLPLSPRDLIVDLRDYAASPPNGARSVLIPDAVPPEAIWSCMQCMACVEICPVGIEHVPIINQLRRSQVDTGAIEAQLQSVFEAVYDSGNSFGAQSRKRAQWTRKLEFQVKDARKEPVELLWFVGDYASLDPRNIRVTQAIAQILHHVGIDFGILFEAERNAGNDVRRAGEEALFADLAERNIEVLSRCEFDRIMTSDPHSYNTLRNEYPSLGGVWPVVHHSELLFELLAAGRLQPERSLPYRVTYHDPCHLGRYNGIYEPPRELLAAIGCELVEMPRSRDNSFCCGAGGGRIWLSGPKSGTGISASESRIHEAVALGGVDYFVTACPKDVTMYEDAIKTSGHEADIELREISELLLEALVIVDGGEAIASPGALTGEAGML